MFRLSRSSLRKMSSVASGRLFWLDAEMTGLDYMGKDRIMEIACIVTDKDLKVVKEGPEFVFKIPDNLLDTMDEWCTKTHGESGLTKKCRGKFKSFQLKKQFQENSEEFRAEPGFFDPARKPGFRV